MVISNLIIGLIGVLLGYAMIRYAYVIVQNTSSISAVENMIGAGQTANFYRILGFFIIIISLLLSVGLLGTTIRGTFSFVGGLLGVK